ncbi:ferrochelatase [Pelobium manganitolerans]|uniref:Ferrochelatase n=1 Tax=Pelobium manganitolerans TaxID=1842495 RepID=A0A419SBF4_9SPHI|nr:ferrochelatase [Pelobium manganitolerans]RKD20117.1 ferrochelatase [Pelobium manganitolerans]
MAKKGILLVNLGTPDSPSTADVRKYLDEFLMDERVIDINSFNRTLLVKGIIVPFRGPKSAKLYKEIWTPQGSPLLIYGNSVRDVLAKKLGADYQVELAMRYQSPSLPDALERLKQSKVDSIKVVPLFPQYASASTGSVHQLVMEIVSKWQAIPAISFVNSFYDHPGMIKVFADNARKHLHQSWDHILFSFHGVPQRQMKKADVSGQHCLKVENCCDNITENNKFCYSAQCHQTAKLLAKELDLKPEDYSLCYQSRLGSDPWMQPYTSDVLKQLAQKGVKRLLVLCPAFVADCLETLYEISVEYQTEFEHLGGEKVQLVESLNDNPAWIAVLEDIVLNK